LDVGRAFSSKDAEEEAEAVDDRCCRRRWRRRPAAERAGGDSEVGDTARPIVGDAITAT